MNFRVKMPRDKLNKAISERNFGEILQNDEFLKRKENPGKSKYLSLKKTSISLLYLKESLYAKFDESKINFQPTYKYSMKDVMEYAEKRVPSYTVKQRHFVSFLYQFYLFLSIGSNIIL